MGYVKLTFVCCCANCRAITDPVFETKLFIPVQLDCFRQRKIAAALSKYF